MQCYIKEKSKEQGITIASQIPKGTKACSSLLSYRLYLHTVFLIPKVHNFPVFLYSTVFIPKLEDKPATEDYFREFTQLATVLHKNVLCLVAVSGILPFPTKRNRYKT